MGKKSREKKVSPNSLPFKAGIGLNNTPSSQKLTTNNVLDNLPIYREPVRLLAALLLLFTIHTWHDPDIWYHLNLGRAIWAQKAFQPTTNFLFQQVGFINFYWLFQLVVYGLFSAGEILLTHILFVITWMIIGWLWFKRVGARYDDIILFTFALLSIFTIQSRISARPDIILFGLLFAQALVFDSAFQKGRLEKKHYILVWLLQVLATNIQSYFILGIGIGAVYFLAESFRSRKIALPALVCFIGLVISSFISPFGWNGWILIFHYTHTMVQMKTVIREFQAPMARHFFEWCYWFQLALTCIAIVHLWWNVRARQAYPIFLATFGCVLSVLMLRNIPFVVLFSAPLWGEVFSRTHFRKKFGPLSFGIATMLIISLSYSVVSNHLYTYTRVSKRFGIGITEDKQPILAVNWLQSKRAEPLRFFNEPDYGGYLAWRMSDHHWFGDSRYVEPDKVLLYFKALDDRTTFDLLNNAYGFQAVLLNKVMSFALVSSLWDDPAWLPIYRDDNNVIIVRRPQSSKP